MDRAWSQLWTYILYYIHILRVSICMRVCIHTQLRYIRSSGDIIRNCCGSKGRVGLLEQVDFACPRGHVPHGSSPIHCGTIHALLLTTYTCLLMTRLPPTFCFLLCEVVFFFFFFHLFFLNSYIDSRHSFFFFCAERI